MLTEIATAEALRPRFPASLPASRNAPAILSSAGMSMSFPRNGEIFAESENSGYVYKVVSGVVRVSKLLPDGRRQISAFHLPGDMFGFEIGDIHHCSAEAVVPTKVVAFKWQGLLGASASTSLVRELLTRTMIGLRHTQDHLLLLGRKNALERLAAFLLEMAARSGSAEILDLAMPRHDIADYLGLTLETVSRMFAELKERGQIKLESARRVRLLNMDKLRAIAA
jgi:CRP/FNR family nitrogen fixation transcriptional regulator